MRDLIRSIISVPLKLRYGKLITSDKISIENLKRIARK